jgi:branched-chain amino acid transport system permease protein
MTTAPNASGVSSSGERSPAPGQAGATGNWLKAWAGPGLVLLVLAALPFVLPALGLGYYVGFVRRLMIVTIAAMSLNFLIGWGGMVALGHAGFVGVGAYTVAALADSGVVSAWGMWLAALAVTAVVAAAIGAMSLRTQGVYFIMITLAFAQMLYYAIVSLRRYGGEDGYNLYVAPALGWGVSATGGNTLYWVVLITAVATFGLLARVAKARFGRALEGIRDNETRMKALGYPVYRIKLVAFIGAAAIAGLSGALLAMQDGFVSPSTMHWTQSALLIVMVTVGGIGHRWGAPLGVVVWLVLEELFRRVTEYWHWPLGVLLIVIVFVAPRGVATLKFSQGLGVLGALRRFRRAAP